MNERPFADYVALRDAAAAVLKLYVDLANSGDAGQWDPYTEPEVQALALLIDGEVSP